VRGGNEEQRCDDNNQTIASRKLDTAEQVRKRAEAPPDQQEVQHTEECERSRGDQKNEELRHPTKEHQEQ
jgi:hypothetical protein